ncbi:hypothetical protein Tco_0470680 [Tanacetum coccineum]
MRLWLPKKGDAAEDNDNAERHRLAIGTQDLIIETVVSGLSKSSKMAQDVELNIIKRLLSGKITSDDTRNRKEEQKQDQGGQKKKDRWVPKRDHPARPVGGTNDGPRP